MFGPKCGNNKDNHTEIPIPAHDTVCWFGVSLDEGALMSSSKFFNVIAVLGAVVLLAIVGVLFYTVSVTGVPRGQTIGYEDRLFDDSVVHTIDIVCDDWEAFKANATNEEYIKVAVVVDDKAMREVGMRAKGNSTLTQVAQEGSDRFSLKLKFDKYTEDQTYYGLEDITLSNMIQDSTCMMDYVCYHLFNEFGVDAPLSSFAWVKVNDEDLGLYTCVEGLGTSFVNRTHNVEDYAIYKPNEQGYETSVVDTEAWDMEKYIAALEELRGGEGTVDRDEVYGTTSSESGGQQQDNGPFGMMGGGSTDTGDAKLQYKGDNPNNYIHILGNSRTDVDEEDVARLVEALRHLGTGEDLENYVDIDEVIRYMVVQHYVQNADSYLGSIIHNFVLYEGSGKLYMTPWDYNLAFGGMMMDSTATDVVNAPIDSPTGSDFVADDEADQNQGGGMFGMGSSSTESYSNRPMVSFIFLNQDYTDRYHELYYEFITTVDIQGIIDNAYNLIKSYVAKDPSAWYTYDEFELGVDTLKKVNELRVQSVYGQLAGTIPSTASGQKADSSSLIDASSITISDMGSQMNTGNGPGHSMGGDSGQQNDGPFGDFFGGGGDNGGDGGGFPFGM